MINIFVPITENVEGFSQFISQVNATNPRGVRFYVGISQKLAKKFNIEEKNVELYTFADKNNIEEIINSLHCCKLKKGKLLVVRRPLTENEFQKLSNSEKDIAVLNKKKGSFVSKFKNFIQSVIKRFFAFTYFDDISAICYKENLFDTWSLLWYNSQRSHTLVWRNRQTQRT